jgi:hypothetical protein
MIHTVFGKEGYVKEYNIRRFFFDDGVGLIDVIGFNNNHMRISVPD